MCSYQFSLRIFFFCVSNSSSVMIPFFLKSSNFINSVYTSLVFSVWSFVSMSAEISLVFLITISGLGVKEVLFASGSSFETTLNWYSTAA